MLGGFPFIWLKSSGAARIWVSFNENQRLEVDGNLYLASTLRYVLILYWQVVGVFLLSSVFTTASSLSSSSQFLLTDTIHLTLLLPSTMCEMTYSTGYDHELNGRWATECQTDAFESRQRLPLDCIHDVHHFSTCRVVNRSQYIRAQGCPRQ